MQNKIYKKLILIIFIVLTLLPSVFSIPVFADENALANISSPSAILIDLKTGKVLFEKNSEEKRYPASLTKVMTAIIIIEKCSLNEIATVSYDAVMELGSGYVTANLQIGEELTVEQLLNVLMVASSNDAAIVLAEHVAGSTADFAVLMNEKAKELGCKNTNFLNPNGVHDENHYTTAYDLALIGKYAMQNETFRSIVCKTSYSLPATDKYPADDRHYTTTNSLLIVNNNNRADNYYYKYTTGIKTGFTTPAGNCLIASSERDKFGLLTVVLGAGETKAGLSARYLDTISLFDYGYNTYTIKEVVKKGSIVQTCNVKGATRDTKRLDIVVQDSISVLSEKASGVETFLPEVKLNDNLKAPIKQGDVVGTIGYKVLDVEYTCNLLASNDVKPSRILIRILEITFLLFIALTYIRMRDLNKKKKRLKNKAYKTH